MLYVVIQALVSGAIIAAYRRSPSAAPVSRADHIPAARVRRGNDLALERHPDQALMTSHAGATFWFVLPSLPMFLLIPALLGRNVSFWLVLGAGCLLTLLLYLGMVWIGSRVGIRLWSLFEEPIGRLLLNRSQFVFTLKRTQERSFSAGQPLQRVG